MLTLVCSLLNRIMPLGEEVVRVRSSPYQGDTRKTLSDTNFTVHLSESMFSFHQSNFMKVINLLTTTEIWTNWEWHSLLWTYL